MRRQGRQELSQYGILRFFGRQDQAHRRLFRRHLSEWRLRKAERDLNWSCPYVAHAAFSPLGVVLPQGADRAVRERYAIHAQQGRSLQRERTGGAVATVADREVSGAARRSAWRNRSGIDCGHRVSRSPLSRRDAVYPRGCRPRLANPAARSVPRSLRPRADAEDRRRPVALGKQGRSARCRGGPSAAAYQLRHDRQGDGDAKLGDGRGIQPRRLRRCTGAVLCQRGIAVRRRPRKRRGLSWPAEGPAVLCACAEGGGAVLRDVSEITGIQPAITSEIILLELSGRQNPFRLIRECRFATGLRGSNKKERDRAIYEVDDPEGQRTGGAGRDPPRRCGGRDDEVQRSAEGG